MKKLATLIFIIGIGISFNANAWFFFWLPTGAIADAFSGAEGANCVAESLKVGDPVMSEGKRMVVKSLSGTSSRCTDSARPIRALLEPDTSPEKAQPVLTTNAKIDFPDGWVQKDIAPALKSGGTVLIARNETLGASMMVLPVPRRTITDSATYVKTRVATQLGIMDNSSATETVQLEINGAKVWQTEVSGNLKTGTKPAYTYLMTFYDGPEELVLINSYALTTVYPIAKPEIQKVLATVTGVVATPLPTPRANVSKGSSSSASGTISKSPTEKLEALNDMLKKGLITQQDYNSKKVQILQGM